MGFGLALLGIGLGMGLLVVGAAYAIGKLAAAAMEGIARQPEAAGNIRGTAIVLAALIEGFTFLAIIFMLLLGGYATGTVEGQGFVRTPDGKVEIVVPIARGHEKPAENKAP